jgi:hypothetical protein
MFFIFLYIFMQVCVWVCILYYMPDGITIEHILLVVSWTWE